MNEKTTTTPNQSELGEGVYPQSGKGAKTYIPWGIIWRGGGGGGYTH